jgi:hypothetical protein
MHTAPQRSARRCLSGYVPSCRSSYEAIGAAPECGLFRSSLTIRRPLHPLITGQFILHYLGDPNLHLPGRRFAREAATDGEFAQIRVIRHFRHADTLPAVGDDTELPLNSVEANRPAVPATSKISRDRSECCTGHTGHVRRHRAADDFCPLQPRRPDVERAGRDRPIQLDHDGRLRRQRQLLGPNRPLGAQGPIRPRHRRPGAAPQSHHRDARLEDSRCRPHPHPASPTRSPTPEM